MSASNTNNPGYSAGEGIKGIFNTVHGVGETIRGNINGREPSLPSYALAGC